MGTKAENMLQMPPVKYAQEFVPKILEEDLALEGFLDSEVKLIFVDATSGYADEVSYFCLSDEIDLYY